MSLTAEEETKAHADIPRGLAARLAARLRRRRAGVAQDERRKKDAAADKPALQLRHRIHADVQMLVTRLKHSGGRLPAMHELSWVRDGKVYLKVTLASGSAAEVETVKKLGFEIKEQTGPALTGRIALEKLEALVESSAVRSAGPWGG